MSVGGNFVLTYLNIQNLGVKGFFKNTAKITGKNVGKAVITIPKPSQLPSETLGSHHHIIRCVQMVII